MAQFLPDQPLIKIFKHLGLVDLTRARAVCRRWRALIDGSVRIEKLAICSDAITKPMKWRFLGENVDPKIRIWLQLDVTTSGFSKFNQQIIGLHLLSSLKRLKIVRTKRTTGSDADRLFSRLVKFTALQHLEVLLKIAEDSNCTLVHPNLKVLSFGGDRAPKLEIDCPRLELLQCPAYFDKVTITYPQTIKRLALYSFRNLESGATASSSDLEAFANLEFYSSLDLYELEGVNIWSLPKLKGLRVKHDVRPDELEFARSVLNELIATKPSLTPAGGHPKLYFNDVKCSANLKASHPYLFLGDSPTDPPSMVTLADLPLIEIFKQLGLVDLTRARAVCRRWRALIDSCVKVEELVICCNDDPKQWPKKWHFLNKEVDRKDVLKLDVIGNGSSKFTQKIVRLHLLDSLKRLKVVRKRPHWTSGSDAIRLFSRLANFPSLEHLEIDFDYDDYPWDGALVHLNLKFLSLTGWPDSGDQYLDIDCHQLEILRCDAPFSQVTINYPETIKQLYGYRFSNCESSVRARSSDLEAFESLELYVCDHLWGLEGVNIWSLPKLKELRLRSDLAYEDDLEFARYDLTELIAKKDSLSSARGSPKIYFNDVECSSDLKASHPYLFPDEHSTDDEDSEADTSTEADSSSDDEHPMETDLSMEI